MGTDSNVFIKLMGPKKKQTGKLFLELAQKKRFEPGTMETFSVEAVDVKEVKEIEVIYIFFNEQKFVCVLQRYAYFTSLKKFSLKSKE